MITILKRKHFPWKLTLNVTDDCNLNCRYCYIKKQKHYMTTEIGQKAVDYAYDNLQSLKDEYKDLKFIQEQ